MTDEKRRGLKTVATAAVQAELMRGCGGRPRKWQEEDESREPEVYEFCCRNFVGRDKTVREVTTSQQLCKTRKQPSTQAETTKLDQPALQSAPEF